MCGALASVAGWYALAMLPLFVTWAIVAARQSIKHLRWGDTGDAILLTTRLALSTHDRRALRKIEVVTRHESPFDRRNAMASVHVDTAGRRGAARCNIPYLDRAVADALHARLAAVVARTELQW